RYLCRHHSVCADPDRCAHRAVVSAGACHRAAPCALWTLRRRTMAAQQIFDLSGQVALVTGASSGLGVRFSECLAENGAAVALVARRADRLASVKARIEKAGGRAVAVGADVLDRAAMTRAFDATEKAFGTVTILVNNAGIAHSGRAVEFPEEE